MKRKFTLITFLFIGYAITVHSQIVNIESARMQSDTTGWMGGAGAAVDLTQNVEKIFGADFEAHMQYKTTNDKGDDQY